MLIALTGLPGSGKDTVYERIDALAPDMPVRRLSFADPLKRSLAALFGIPVAEVERWKRGDAPFVLGNDPALPNWTMRELLQRYGTEAHRDVFGADFWLDQTLPHGFDHEFAIWVVTDCRFENEARRVKALGGVVWHVGHWRIDGEANKMFTHASDAPIPAYLVDSIILNNRRDDGFASLDTTLRRLLPEGVMTA